MRVCLICLLWMLALAQGVPDVCQLEYETGECKAAIPRWYHNKHTGQCEQFVYGGCQGNGNNFSSQEECLNACVMEASGSGDDWDFEEGSGSDDEEGSGSKPDQCHLAAEVGPCKAAIPRWAYDPQTNSCKTFTFGGCDGNENNFSSEEQCLDACAWGTSVGAGSSWESDSDGSGNTDGSSGESSSESGDFHYELK